MNLIKSLMIRIIKHCNLRYIRDNSNDELPELIAKTFFIRYNLKLYLNRRLLRTIQFKYGAFINKIKSHNKKRTYSLIRISSKFYYSFSIFFHQLGSSANNFLKA